MAHELNPLLGRTCGDHGDGAKTPSIPIGKGGANKAGPSLGMRLTPIAADPLMGLLKKDASGVLAIFPPSGA